MMIKVQAQRLPTTQHTLPTQPPDEQARPPAPRPQHTKHARYEEGELLSTRQYVVQARVARGSSTPAHTLDESSCGLLHATTLPPCTCLHCRGGGRCQHTQIGTHTACMGAHAQRHQAKKRARDTRGHVDKPRRQTPPGTDSDRNTIIAGVGSHCGGHALHCAQRWSNAACC